MTAIVEASHSRSYRAFARWVAASYHYAAWILLASLLIAVACAVYTSRNLGMNSATTDMLSEHLPFRANYKHYKKTFPQDQDMDTLVLVLDAPTPEQAHTATKRLAERLKEDATNIKDTYLPSGDVFFERNGLLYESIPELGRITDRLAAAQPLIARIAGNPTLHTFASVLTEAVEELRAGRSLELESVLGGVSATLDARLAGVPRALSWQVLFRGEAQKSTYRELMTVQPKLDYTQLAAAEQSITALRATARDLTEDGSVRLRVTGDVALADEELKSAMHGTEYAGLLALVLVTVVLYFALHTAGPILTVLLSLVLGLLLTAAFAAAAVGQLNVISIAFAVLYVGLGVDYAIHFLLRYRELLEDGQPTVQALQATGGDTGHSLFLCAVTTAIGFYAFMPTAYRGVAELGLIAGTGMLISLVVTLTLAPALQRYLPTRPGAASTGAEGSLGKLLELPLRWRKVVYAGTFAALLAAVAVLPKIEFDYNLLNLQDQRGEAVQTFRELLAETEHSPWHAVALADNEVEVDRLAQRLTGLPEVSRVVTVLDFIPTAQEEKLALIEEMALTLGPLTLAAAPPVANQYTLAQQRAALGALSTALDRFIAERPDHPALVPARSLRTSLGALLTHFDTASSDDKNKLLHAVGKDLLALLPDAMQRLHTSIEATPFNQQQLPESLRTRWHSQTGQYRIAIYPAENINDNQALRRFVRAVQQEAPQATGAPVISLEAGEAVVQAFILAFSLALAGIIIILLVMLRSVASTLLVLTPLLLAALFTGAATVLLGVQFNFANIIALPLLLGIGLDSGLHMVHRSRSDGTTHEELMHTSTTRAIFYSALTTLVGFGSLAFSSHQGTASMGVLLTIGLALTLICILVILPVLLATAARGRIHEKVMP
ncbi:MAG: MMPL family transporter [Nitrosomonadaceae bacterium]|nr:MMPL family transporter [Nitrosomonadaceae bacterium]